MAKAPPFNLFVLFHFSDPFVNADQRALWDDVIEQFAACNPFVENTTKVLSCLQWRAWGSRTTTSRAWRVVHWTDSCPSAKWFRHQPQWSRPCRVIREESLVRSRTNLCLRKRTNNRTHACAFITGGRAATKSLLLLFLWSGPHWEWHRGLVSVESLCFSMQDTRVQQLRSHFQA